MLKLSFVWEGRILVLHHLRRIISLHIGPLWIRPGGPVFPVLMSAGILYSLWPGVAILMASNVSWTMLKLPVSHALTHTHTGRRSHGAETRRQNRYTRYRRYSHRHRQLRRPTGQHCRRVAAIGAPPLAAPPAPSARGGASDRAAH